ncbi:hypothetical protein GCM10010172_79660 [Paractinoplanes ferrugineus]|uniref:Uncharacterized protein n=1 Tax=Paractinoplanes ferrugineus TaxID=113564 RepID=A0A919J322_9ACTN|nr:hypothetical protein [Actinoplanes ferrugineus]GIE13040.1 hypothetical protein Afe05nite_48800 [Actinoplanes ferrugineus]
MDDALVAYGAGHADGKAGAHDGAKAVDPATGADYLVGIVDGQVAAFEEALVAAVRRALDRKSDGPGV